VIGSVNARDKGRS